MSRSVCYCNYVYLKDIRCAFVFVCGGVHFYKYFVLYIGYIITNILTFHIYKSVQTHTHCGAVVHPLRARGCSTVPFPMYTLDYMFGGAHTRAGACGAQNGSGRHISYVSGACVVVCVLVYSLRFWLIFYIVNTLAVWPPEVFSSSFGSPIWLGLTNRKYKLRRRPVPIVY